MLVRSLEIANAISSPLPFKRQGIKFQVYVTHTNCKQTSNNQTASNMAKQSQIVSVG